MKKATPVEAYLKRVELEKVAWTKHMLSRVAGTIQLVSNAKREDADNLTKDVDRLDMEEKGWASW
jgi:hypothetical protein